MRRTSSALLAAVVASGALCGVGTPQESPRGGSPGAAAVAKAAAARSEDESGVRDAIDAFARAFAKGDAKAIAGLFTEDGEAIDAEGEAIQGRAALERHYESRIAGGPRAALEIRAESVSMIAPGVARVAGRTRLAPADGTEASVARFAAIFVRRDGRWLLASVRELPDRELSPRERLEELAWLVGDWVEESDEAVVSTSVAWSDNGAFLLRTFEVRVKGKPELTGTQRIGWDPLTKQFKSWVFDSDGSYTEGLWTRQDNGWLIKATGVRPDGRVATATQVLTSVTRDSFRWKSIDRTIGGESAPDIDEVVMVRRSPRPRGPLVAPNRP